MVDRDRVDREEGGCDHRHGSRQPVHVVEQVEGVGDPHEPEDAHEGREGVVRDDVHGEAGGEDECRRTHLCRQLRGWRQGADVVDEPRREDDRAAAEDAEQLLARLDSRCGHGRCAGSLRVRS